MDFNFHMPVHVVSGEGAVARNSTLLRTLGRRCLIITGGSSAKRSGALADVTAALDLWEIGWAVYDAVGPNPLVSACHEAGVEIGGAVKNVIAIATGVAQGLGLGDNAQAALITRGLTEITRLGVSMGAEADTFSGLAGLGDLVVTCGSRHSRNRRAGIEIGKGRPWNQVLEDMGMVVEGVYATENTYKLAQQYGVEMPITEQVYYMLYEGRSPKEAMWSLMTRAKTQERLIF